MKTTCRSTKAQSFLLLCLALTAPSVQCQEAQKPLSRSELITLAREVIKEARYCALITQDASGRPQVRTVDPLSPDENMVVWIGTNPLTRKVAQIRRNPRVTLYYIDREAQAYVTIWGTARLVNDPKEKARVWKEEWKPYYPDRDKHYLLILVKPERLEVINVKKGILGDPKTWKPPSVSFVKAKSKN